MMTAGLIVLHTLCCIQYVAQCVACMCTTLSCHLHLHHFLRHQQDTDLPFLSLAWGGEHQLQGSNLTNAEHAFLTYISLLSWQDNAT